MRKLLIGVVAVATVMLVAGTSRATTTQLIISTGALHMTFSPVTDQTIDTGPISLGGWSVTVDAQSHSPNLAPDNGLAMDALNIRCNTAPCVANPLTLTLSSTDFTQPNFGNFNAGATTLRMTGAITYTSKSFWDASNTLNGTASPINTHTIVGPSVGNSELSSGGGPAGPAPYSLSLIDSYSAAALTNAITATGSDIAGQIPEPSTLLLFGTGLLLLGIVVRRKQVVSGLSA